MSLTSEHLAALTARTVVRRFFVWVEARTAAGDAAPIGYWDDVGVIDVQGRTYYGSGSLISIGDISGDMSGGVLSLPIRVSGISDEIAYALRGWRIDQVPITVRLGLFDPATRALVGGLIPHFAGRIDKCTITTPEAGGEAIIDLTCESASRDLTRASSDVRSASSQQRRKAGDDFYLYAGALKNKPIYFGRAKTQS